MGVAAMMLAQGAASAPPSAVTWNPADTGSNISLSGGNLVATKINANSYTTTRATLGRPATDAGGYYYECVMTGSGSDAPFALIGIGTATTPALNNYAGSDSTSYGYYQQTGEKVNSGTLSAHGASYTTGDVIGVLVKNGKLYFRKNGAWQNSGDPAAETGFAFSGITGTVYPVLSLYRYDGASPHSATGRFKAADFTGSIPSGAAAWE